MIGDPKVKYTHKDGKPFLTSITCQVCGRVFEHTNYSNRAQMSKQYCIHYNQHEMETTDCGCEDITFKSMKERNCHWMIVHKGQKQCNKCNYTFASDLSLKEHIKNVHCERKCDKCDYKTTRGSYALKVHKREQHELKEKLTLDMNETNVNQFRCPEDFCGKPFSCKGKLNAHVNKVHVISTCPHCGKQVKNLKQHIVLVHQPEAKKYQCDKCPKAFSEACNLKTHEMVDHQGLRFYCRYPDCRTKSQEYRDSSNRAAHERKRHGGPFNLVRNK